MENVLKTIDNVDELNNEALEELTNGKEENEDE